MVGDKNNHLFKVGRPAAWVMAERETVLLSQVERQLTHSHWQNKERFILYK